MIKFNIILKAVGDHDKHSWSDGPHADPCPELYAEGYVDAYNTVDPEIEFHGAEVKLLGVMRLVDSKRRVMKPKPWTKAEKKEIAQLRKQGRSESYIFGFMKIGNNRRGSAPPLKERTMATKKKASKKAAKKTSKKVTKKVAGKKAAGKAGRKTGGFQCGDTLTAVPGLDDKFYKKFPRYAAYQLICKKKTMKTVNFVAAVEKLDGVKTRGQALGILTKLLNKGCVKASGKVQKA